MTDRIAEAARATRKYWPVPHWSVAGHYYAGTIESLAPNDTEHWPSYEEAQAACDLLNLIAVLEALREPSEGMVDSGDAVAAYGGVIEVWSVMIDAAIAEVRKSDEHI